MLRLLELISDIYMHLFIEKGMRGGISYIAIRHSKANDKCTENYDSSKEVCLLCIWTQIICMVGQ